MMRCLNRHLINSLVLDQAGKEEAARGIPRHRGSGYADARALPRGEPAILSLYPWKR
jgi:hypothetical protein